jgi:LPXTG-motif cell wall-anchored protein
MRGLGRDNEVNVVRKRLPAFGLLLFCCLSAFAPVAHAQVATYPPTTLPAACLQVSGDVRLVNGILEVLFEGNIVMFGPAGCALPGETVDGSVASDPVFLGSTTANSDGSWAIPATLPASILPGNHTLIADFGPGRAQLVQPILVVTSFSAAAGAAAARAGTLPKTGGNIAANAMWGMLLVVVGLSLVLYARRRGMLRLATAGGFAHRVSQGRSGRRKPRTHTTDLLEVDTARFVPVVPREKPEADIDDWPFFTPPD